MSLPRYSEYKDSGVEWLGEVPGHWGIAPFYSVATEREESNIGMQEDNLLSLSYGRIVQKDISSNDGLLPESFETYQIVRPGDIVFRLTDLQNDKRSLRTAIVEETGIITSAYVAAKPTKIEPRYLCHLLRAYDVTKVFYSMGGGLRQSMKFSDLKRLPTLLPPPDEQQTIAAFLDRETGKIDALIAEQRRLVELLAEKRQAVISHAVTKGLNPNAKMKDSGIEWLGDVPRHWDVRPLKHLARLQTGMTPPTDDWDNYSEDEAFHWVRPEDLDETGTPTKATKFLTCKGWGLTRQIAAGASLICCIGTIGKVGFTNNTASTNQQITAAEPLQDGRYLFFAIRAGRSELELASTGNVLRILNTERLGNIRFPSPPLAEQAQIAAYLDSESAKLDTLTAEANRAIALLQERRSALISAAVTGKIDVRNYLSNQEKV